MAGRRQAIIETNDLLSIGTIGTNFNVIRNHARKVSLKKMQLRYRLR